MVMEHMIDGARVLWSYIRQNERYNGYEMLLDYCHTLEHLSLAAEALFGKGSVHAKDWYDKYRKKLLEEEEGPRKVLLSMAYFAPKEALSGSRRKDYQKERTFFMRDKTKMTCAGFRRRGLPVGSGPVEAACKSLIKTRLCGSGMRWTRKGGQNILALRTVIKSNRWDAFWNHYKTNMRAA